MAVRGRVAEAQSRLSPSERKVAEVLVAEPATVAFGTVAAVAARAGTGVATVARLAGKLGYDGFTALQQEVQAELSDSLRPAAERIRELDRGGGAAARVLERAAAAGVENVQATLGGVPPRDLDRAVRLLASRTAGVLVAAGDESAGIAQLFSAQLGMLRAGVSALEGSPVEVARRLALARRGDVLVAIDVRRYDRWLLDAVARARRAGLHVVSVTDSPLSPLAEGAAVSFVIGTRGAGPFDSQVGALALVDALLTALAERLKTSATARLDSIEAAWRASGVLTEG